MSKMLRIAHCNTPIFAVLSISDHIIKFEFFCNEFSPIFYLVFIMNGYLQLLG